MTAGTSAGRPDLRIVVPALAVWVTSLAILGAASVTAYTVAGLVSAAAAPMLLRGHADASVRRRRATVGAALVCAAAAAAGVGFRLSAVGSGPVRALAAAGESASLDAVVTADPEVRPGRRREIVVVRARAEVVRARGRLSRVRVPVVVLASGPAWRGLLPSQRVRFIARLAPPRHGELLAAAALVRGPPTVLGPPSVVQRAATAVRASLREATGSLPAAQRGVLPGMVVGDVSQLDPHVAEDFRTAGLTHLLVVSGSNLSLIIGAVLALTRLAGLGRRYGPLVAGLAVLAFVVVARPDPSVLRATVMGVIGLVALVGGRERQGLPALAAAVLVLVLIDPELARSYGFVLSALATAGLLVIAPRLRDRWARRLPRPLAEALAVSAAAQIACAPVIVMLSGQVSLVSIPANLLAAPAIGPATVLGAVAALVSLGSMPMARLLVMPAGLAVGWIVWVARTAAAVPYATLPWRDGAVGAALLVAFCVVAYMVLRRPVLRRFAVVAAAMAVAAVIGVRVLAPGWPPPGWLLVACDIGQGDALALFAGTGRAVVVDAGPEPRLVDRCLRDLRIGAVPLLVLTHPHADHVDGVPGVLHGRAVGAVLTSPDSAGEELRLLRGRVPAAAVPRAAHVGDSWTAGPVSLSVLGPLPGVTGDHVSNHDDGTTVNNASIVLVARWPGMTALLSGDVEPAAQRALAAAGVPPADILKVPHHGSVRQDPGFLAASHARIAITSVGADNDYGHPAPATLALLDRLGIRGYRTDCDGDVAVVRTDGRLGVVVRGATDRRR